MLLPIVRLLVVLLLALMVPLQGFTAASAGICMASGHHDMAAEHSHDDGSTHSHDDGDFAPKAHCAPCVACCAAAAIVSSMLVVNPDERADALNATAPPQLAGVQLERLDRPPLPL